MKQQFTRKLMLLAVMLLAGVASSFAFVYGDLTYRIIDSDAKTARVSYQGTNAWSNPYTQSSITIPETVPFNGDYYTVVEIGENAFANSSLSSITIPPSITTVGNDAFESCKNLISADLSNVQTFGSYIFKGCTSLTSVKLPAGITAIPNAMFSGCTNITSFPFPDNIRIEDGAFEGTGLSSIPTSCSYIGSNAFANCPNLTSVNITCEIGTYAFSNCENLKSVVATANNIGDYAFQNCSQLENVTLMGSTVFCQIGGQFYGCDKINKIICLAHYYGNLGFTDNVKESAAVIVPESQVSNWKSNGFFNVQAADVNNVGGHVVDVAAYGASGGVFVNGQYADGMYGQAFIINPGTDVELKFGSYDEVWQLATFTLNGVDKFSDVVDNKYTIKNINGNQNIIATWKEIASYEVNYYANDYSLGTVYANGKELSMYNNSLKFAAGTNISLSITPKSGYGVGDFNVNKSDKKSDLIHNSDGSYSYSFTLNSKTELSITYAEIWSLTTTFNTGGTVTVGSESVTSGTTKEMAVGSMMNVYIVPNTGYEVTSILYNGTEVINTAWVKYLPNGSYEIYPTSAQGTTQTLAITFQIVNPTISANYDTTMGSVSIAGSQLMPTMPQSFAIGSNVTFTITPNLGYEINSVMLNGPTSTDITAAVIANGNSHTISNINDNYTINVTFAAIPTPATVTATIGTLGMATLYSPYALDFSGVSGLKAYIVSAFTPANNRAILTPVNDVPAKTAVVLVGSAGNYTIPTTTTKTYVANLLKGVDSDVKMNTSDGTFTNYILTDGKNGLGFYPIDDNTILAAGKAYLAIPNTSTSGAPQFVSMDIEGTITGIKNIDADVTGKAVYNLNGQRQNSLKKGINIVGGKKIVVK